VQQQVLLPSLCHPRQRLAGPRRALQRQTRQTLLLPVALLLAPMTPLLLLLPLPLLGVAASRVPTQTMRSLKVMQEVNTATLPHTRSHAPGGLPGGACMHGQLPPCVHSPASAALRSADRRVAAARCCCPLLLLLGCQASSRRRRCC
jgi:hypothetical protein